MAATKIKTEEISETTKAFAAETLTGDIQAFLVDHFRALDTTFKKLNEDQQRDFIADARRAAESVVTRAVQIIASDGKESIPVTVKKVENNGEEIKISMEASKYDENRHMLFDAAGCSAFLTVADPEKYMGGEAPQPEPDQPELAAAAE